VESIPGGAIPLFVGGLVGAVIWQFARKARTFFASGEPQDKEQTGSPLRPPRSGSARKVGGLL